MGLEGLPEKTPTLLYERNNGKEGRDLQYVGLSADKRRLIKKELTNKERKKGLRFLVDRLNGDAICRGGKKTPVFYGKNTPIAEEGRTLGKKNRLP